MDVGSEDKPGHVIGSSEGVQLPNAYATYIMSSIMRQESPLFSGESKLE